MNRLLVRSLSALLRPVKVTPLILPRHYRLPSFQLQKLKVHHHHHQPSFFSPRLIICRHSHSDNGADFKRLLINKEKDPQKNKEVTDDMKMIVHEIYNSLGRIEELIEARTGNKKEMNYKFKIKTFYDRAHKFYEEIWYSFQCFMACLAIGLSSSLLYTFSKSYLLRGELFDPEEVVIATVMGAFGGACLWALGPVSPLIICPGILIFPVIYNLRKDKLRNSYVRE